MHFTDGILRHSLTCITNLLSLTKTNYSVEILLVTFNIQFDVVYLAMQYIRIILFIVMLYLIWHLFLLSINVVYIYIPDAWCGHKLLQIYFVND